MCSHLTHVLTPHTFMWRQDYQGFANEVGRQLLRKRRSFTATVFSADGGGGRERGGG